MSERFGSLPPAIRVTPPGPESLRLGRRLERVESQNVTRLAPDFPVFWSEAQGANVRDADGNIYVDLTAAFGVALAGHSNPRIAQRIAEASSRFVHGMGDVHPPAIKVDLLERLGRLLPWDDPRTVLASSGSEAVEIALKTALLATGRPGILAFEGGYHGLTLGALAATGRADFRDPFRRRLYEAAFVPFPHRREDDPAAKALTAVERALDRGAPGGDPIGAVIVEPIQGRGGVRIPPAGFLGDLAAIAQDRGALLLLDEIYTGMGRTGRLLACEHEGVVPDLICLGKALGGGLPLSACAGPASVMDAWPPSSGEALHTSTFLGHPLACASALAFLDELEAEGLVERAEHVGDRLRGALGAALASVDDRVRDIRGRGAFLGVELARPGGEAWAGGGAAVSVSLLRRGYLVLPAGTRGEVVELSPPVTITDEQIDGAAEAIGAAVRAL